MKTLVLTWLIRLGIVVFVVLIGMGLVPKDQPANNLKTEIPKAQDLHDQVAMHKTKTDCWLSINGQVYDITSYFGHHPGGDKKLEKYCGLDATQGWETKDERIGQMHSAVAQMILRDYEVK